MIDFNQQIINDLVNEYIKLNKGETKVTVAAKMGLSKVTLYAANPTANTIVKVCNFLGINPDRLFFQLPNRGETVNTSVNSPAPEYNSKQTVRFTDKEFIEQKDEISRLKDDVIKWMQKAHDLELELEKAKKTDVTEECAQTGS